MISYNKERWNDYKSYHLRMLSMGDCDPAYPALRYIAERYDLNSEQRYWLAWLYACCYSVPTAFYIYNEFPDYENVDVRRLQRWWDINKKKLLFQTDRMKVKNFNKFVIMFESYKKEIGASQERAFKALIIEGSPKLSYDNVYSFANELYYFGRYSLFLYLEALHELTGIEIEPTGLDLKNADSCRNGLCYAIGRDELVEAQPTKEDYVELDAALKLLHDELKEENPSDGITYWNIETSLCAYKKLYWNKRYLGYYIDRQADEISTMQAAGCEGVDWSPLWDFRREFFDARHISKGVNKKLMGIYKKEDIACYKHLEPNIKKGNSYA